MTASFPTDAARAAARDAPPDALAFSAGGRRLALPSAAVERVLEVPVTGRVPGTPDWFAGLAVLAGRLLPVTDLGAWFRTVADVAEDAPEFVDVGGSPDPTERRLLELAAPYGPVGLLVDRVDGLRPVDESGGLADPSVELLDPGALTGAPSFVDLTRAGRPS